MTDEGISVFPYLRPKERRLSRVALNDVERVPSGVPGLDDLLMGGYVRDTTILLAGPSGSGKTTLGLHFLVNGASRGESGLLLSFQESPDRIAQMMCMLDPDTPRYIDDGLLYIEHILPLDVCVEETFHKLMAWCDEYGLRRLVVDSITDLLSGSDDELIVRDQAYTLVKLMEEKGVTTLMTYEMPQMSGSVTISEIGFSFIADAVIYLGFAEIESEMSKVIGVLKLRGGRHQTDLRELLVTERGLRVGAKFTGLSGILQGTPIGQYRETVEEILQPLAFINDFIDVLREGELDEEMRHEVLSNMKEQTEHVIRLLCEKYDIEYETVMSGAQEGM
ncbi:MAG TPA: hypothetical protein EYP10_12740 [Armatimonadetes bacterium]|nr:hypothetical protein [Armatimonadota bacterium]